MKPFFMQPPSGDHRRAKQMVLILVANLMLFGTLYYLLPLLGFYYLPFIYLGIASVLALWYVIYNKGFRTLHKTPDMLPDSFTLEEREFMVADGKRRMESSRWMLLILLPIIAVFLIDYIYLLLPEDLLS